MLKITISDTPRQAFINHACRYAFNPIHIIFKDDHLIIDGLSPEDAATSLAYSAFFVWETQCLHALIRKYFPDYIDTCADDLAAIAQILTEEDIPAHPLYQGKNRANELTHSLQTQLMKGSLDFLGFCRFRLDGYQDYLYHLLMQAEDELFSEAEEYQYLCLLRNCLGEGAGHISLFFSPGDICQIWRKDEKGFHQLEGGHIKGAEWLLIANLISWDPISLSLYNASFAEKTLIHLLNTVFEGKISFNIDASTQNTTTTIT
jgi:hypothetical protein